MEGFVAYQGALGKTKYFQLLTSDTNHLSPAIQNLFFFESWICRSCIYTYIFLSESSSKNEMILSKSKSEGFFLDISSDSLRVPTHSSGWLQQSRGCGPCRWQQKRVSEGREGLWYQRCLLLLLPLQPTESHRNVVRSALKFKPIFFCKKM